MDAARSGRVEGRLYKLSARRTGKSLRGAKLKGSPPSSDDIRKRKRGPVVLQNLLPGPLRFLRRESEQSSSPFIRFRPLRGVGKLGRESRQRINDREDREASVSASNLNCLLGQRL